MTVGEQPITRAHLNSEGLGSLMDPREDPKNSSCSPRVPPSVTLAPPFTFLVETSRGLFFDVDHLTDLVRRFARFHVCERAAG